MFVAICLIDLRNISFNWLRKKIGMPNKQDVSLHDCPFCLFRCFRKMKFTICQKPYICLQYKGHVASQGNLYHQGHLCTEVMFYAKVIWIQVHVVSQCQLHIKVMLNYKVIYVPRSWSNSCHPIKCSKLSPYYGFNQNCEW